MSGAGYGQFCPVSMAAEILCRRWTVVLLRELIAGSTRFNDLKRGVPRMSPALLSQRLKELQAAGILDVVSSDAPRSSHEYILTDAGRDLLPVVESIGIWGQRWIETDLVLENLDPSLLMWDMRRNLNTSSFPSKQVTIEFWYPELEDIRKRWWLIITPDSEVDLCSVDPGFEVDLTVETSLQSMTAVWMGHTCVDQEVDKGTIILHGDKGLSESMQKWIGLSPFASEKNRLN